MQNDLLKHTEQVIREADVSDIVHIRKIAHATWPVAYHPHILSTEQLAYMLDLLYSEEALSEALSKGQHFLVFEQDGTPIGFSGYTHHRNGLRTTYLNKLYVLPTVQGSGAGRSMLQHIARQAVLVGDTCMELNVNKRNAAIGFYERLGFRITREEVIDIGSGFVMDDYVQVKSLV